MKSRSLQIRENVILSLSQNDNLSVLLEAMSDPEIINNLQKIGALNFPQGTMQPKLQSGSFLRRNIASPVRRGLVGLGRGMLPGILSPINLLVPSFQAPGAKKHAELSQIDAANKLAIKQATLKRKEKFAKNLKQRATKYGAAAQKFGAVRFDPSLRYFEHPITGKIIVTPTQADFIAKAGPIYRDLEAKQAKALDPKTEKIGFSAAEKTERELLRRKPLYVGKMGKFGYGAGKVLGIGAGLALGEIGYNIITGLRRGAKTAQMGAEDGSGFEVARPPTSGSQGFTPKTPGS